MSLPIDAIAGIAIVLELVPVLVFVGLRLRRERELWEIALDVPLAVALDLVSILLLTRALPLETSILVSRPLWILGGAAYAVRTKRRGLLAWPRALGRMDVACALVSACAAVYLSQTISRHCHVADRAWHSGIVPSIRGETIPFVNVYQPKLVLAYHYAGDVLGASIQVLSSNVLQASNALSWAHDVAFGLTGASAALLFRWLGFRSITGACLATLGVLLSGPLTILRPDRPEGGYNFIDLFKLSYRPHTCLATLLFIGFVGAMLVRLAPRGEAILVRKTAPILLACTALLAVTDETSLGLYGLAIGAAWIADANALAPRRKTGALVLVGLLATFAAATLVFASALAPGAPKHPIAFVPWRSPGYLNPPIPLSSPRGVDMLLYDLAPMLGVLAAGVLARLRTQRRGVTPGLVFLAVVLGVGIVGLCRLDVDGAPIENHRFMTASLFAFPFIGATWLPWLRRAPGQGWSATAGRFVAPLFIVSVGLSAVSSLWWMRSVGTRRWCTKPKSYGSRDDFFKTDCVKEAGARFGEKPVPTYVEQPIYFLQAGCRPGFTSGPEVEQWALHIGFPNFGKKALLDFDRNMLNPGEPLRVVCRKEGSRDAICLAVEKNGTCKPQGSRLVQCELSGAERAALVAKMTGKAPAHHDEDAPEEPTGAPEDAESK